MNSFEVPTTQQKSEKKSVDNAPKFSFADLLASFLGGLSGSDNSETGAPPNKSDSAQGETNWAHISTMNADVDRPNAYSAPRTWDHLDVTTMTHNDPYDYSGNPYMPQAAQQLLQERKEKMEALQRQCVNVNANDADSSRMQDGAHTRALSSTRSESSAQPERSSGISVRAEVSEVRTVQNVSPHHTSMSQSFIDVTYIRIPLARLILQGAE